MLRVGAADAANGVVIRRKSPFSDISKSTKFKRYLTVCDPRLTSVMLPDLDLSSSLSLVGVTRRSPTRWPRAIVDRRAKVKMTMAL